MIAALAAVTAAGTAHATQGGGGAYPNGAEDFMAGAVPPPGTYLLNYLNYYSADKLVGNSGNEIANGFELDVVADVVRVLHVTNTQLLGGNWGFQLFVPLVYMDVTVPGPGSDSRASLGDIIIDPLILSWHGKNWHAVTGIDIFMPTGNFTKGHLANVGRNYWTIEPIVAATYITDSGFELSGKFMYDFNTKNTDLDYTSGQEFHFDYAAGQKVNNFTLGLAGYFYQQTTDDEQFGRDVPNDGNKGRVLAVGPAVKYDYKNMSFSAKYLFETLVENRPVGGNLWVKFMYAF